MPRFKKKKEITVTYRCWFCLADSVAPQSSGPKSTSRGLAREIMVGAEVGALLGKSLHLEEDSESFF